jgi:hypothetical protein
MRHGMKACRGALLGALGAVRGNPPDANALAVYVENGGDFVVPLEAVRRVHNGKVILNAG